MQSAREEELKKLEADFSGNGNSISNRRILQEYRILSSSTAFPNISVDFENGHNIYTWLVHINITNYEIDANLRKDFEVYASRYSRPKEIVFEIRFPSNYPTFPPFIRFIRPRINFRTGHVTIGGSICVEGLTKTGWLSMRSIENVLVEILDNLKIGRGSLDIAGSRYDYQFHEAQDAFMRSARVHGWAI